MTTFLSKEVQAGLDADRLTRLRRESRQHLVVGNTEYPILRLWKTGFSVLADTAPKLRGFVDVYEGDVHLFQCLIVASEDGEGGERVFEFKRATAVSSKPALDHARRTDAPVALIAHLQ